MRKRTFLLRAINFKFCIYFLLRMHERLRIYPFKVNDRWMLIIFIDIIWWNWFDGSHNACIEVISVIISPFILWLRFGILMNVSFLSSLVKVNFDIWVLLFGFVDVVNVFVVVVIGLLSQLLFSQFSSILFVVETHIFAEKNQEA